MIPARQDAIRRDHIVEIVSITTKLSPAGCKLLRDAARIHADLDRKNVRNEKDRVRRATKTRGAARAKGRAR